MHLQPWSQLRPRSPPPTVQLYTEGSQEIVGAALPQLKVLQARAQHQFS